MESESKPLCAISSCEYYKASENGFRNAMLVGQRPRVLLHACCGPCATSCVERLVEDYTVTVFYYNPNIMDAEEYIKRRDALMAFITAFNRENPDRVVGCVEGKYEPEAFIGKVRALKDEPEGGRRCSVCFEMRLAETARKARVLEADCFTTSMTVSPHKDYEAISACGKRLGDSVGVEYLALDFKKKNGFGRSVELSRKYGLYRQSFCGCDYARGDR